MGEGSTTAELMVELGEQLRAQRLRANLTLEEVAGKTGLSINAVRRLESGEGSTLASFVAVLKALQRESWLSTLRPAVTVSPLAMLQRKTPRLRAYKPRGPSKSNPQG